MMVKRERPLINHELLYDILLEATAFPEVHEQTVWGMRTVCGTAYCIAGMANAFEDETLVFVAPSSYAEFKLNAIAEAMGSDVESRARELLGLTCDQSEDFFDEENGIDDLWRMASEYTDGAVTRPADSVIAEYRLMGSRIKKIDAPYFPTG